jgi:glycosyltransferase involved in cell wall biosynthesis
VALSAGSVPEIAGDAAILIEGDDPGEVAAAVLSIVNDDQVRRQLGARGLARAAEFTWERTAERTLRVYDDVLADAASRP